MSLRRILRQWRKLSGMGRRQIRATAKSLDAVVVETTRRPIAPSQKGSEARVQVPERMQPSALDSASGFLPIHRLL